ncbi:MAG: EAL domain-containing protein [Magnetococcales bacterium]|nr:EAL domain-containing protein [Magnetococcales bacterium]NGZ06719.1 EAL domain-containing protein [Magnetococcales bacterium]
MDNSEPVTSSVTTSQIALEDLQLLMANLPDGILLHRNGTILLANRLAAVILGMGQAEELHGTQLRGFFNNDAWNRQLQSIDDQPPMTPGRWTAEMELTRCDHRQGIVDIATGWTMFQGEPALLSTLRDITQVKRGEEEMRRQANYDTLTGLPNRSLFLDRLNRELIRAKRSHSRVALMFIDLDRFKWVNDTMGHAAGDELLRQTSKRLLSCVRKSDTVARLGGDEFTVILPDMAHGPYAERVAAEILSQLIKPFVLMGQEAFISGSVGVTVCPDDADDLDSLLKNADTAMYRAKSDGRNAYRFFTPDMHAEAEERMALEKDLHYALERGELVVHYQPIVDLASGRLIGAESFLRWEHPKRGNVSPATFVRLAEEIGMIAQITAWTIQTACAQAQQWRQRPDSADFVISVNISCTRCRELSTDDKIPDILRATGLPPTALILEITENILSEDEGKAMDMLHHLSRQGVNLWLDDFGTGYSSLSVLKRLPVNGIKIDRTFIPDIAVDSESAVLVQAILSLAQAMNRKVIGEGIESLSQADFLRTRGCQMGQGYLFHKPVNAATFETILGTTFPVG